MMVHDCNPIQSKVSKTLSQKQDSHGGHTCGPSYSRDGDKRIRPKAQVKVSMKPT
jgi:hypothetical protein